MRIWPPLLHPLPQFAGIWERLCTHTWHKLKVPAVLASFQGAGANISWHSLWGVCSTPHNVQASTSAHAHRTLSLGPSSLATSVSPQSGWSPRWESGQMYRHRGRHMRWGSPEKGSTPGLTERALGGCPHTSFLVSTARRTVLMLDKPQPHSQVATTCPRLSPPPSSEALKSWRKIKRQWTGLCALNLWNRRTFSLGFSCLKFRTARGLGFQS